MPGLATLVTTLRACTSARTKAILGGLVALGILSRLGVVGLALAVARSEVRLATAVGVATAAVTLVQRILSLSARVAVDCDAHRAAARALLDADVLAISPYDVRRAIDEGIWHAQEVVAQAVPAVVADSIVALLVVPVVVSLPQRLLLLAAIATAIILVLVVPLRRWTRRLQDRAVDARMKLGDTFAFAVEGRLELVAHGGKPEFMGRFASEIDTYARLVRRSSLGAAFLGRAPIAFALGVVALVLAFDPTSREALVGKALSSSLVLAACIPPFFGAVLGAHTLVRGLSRLAPFLSVLTMPPRPDVGRGGEAPTVPAAFAGENLSFRYTPDALPSVNDVSFEWRPGKPLVLVGANGAGKSTLLRLLLGLRPPTSGSITLGPNDLAAVDLALLRKEVAYVPQRPYLGESHTSVRAALQGARENVTDEVCLRALDRVALRPALGTTSAVLERRVGELSGGQRQRLAIARAIMHDTRIYLFDEPDANLDIGGVALMAALVRGLVAEGKMVALAAHTPELAAVSDAPVSLDARRTKVHA